MMLRIQAERLAGLHLDLEDYKSRYQANGARMAAYAPKALLMHPGPIIRGLELTSEVADGPQSLIADQVSHAGSRFAWRWWRGRCKADGNSSF